MTKTREIYFFKGYFHAFFKTQPKKVKKKILWTLRLITELERIPEIYFKKINGSNGLYEIRVQTGNNIYRIFCFFDRDNLVVVGNGFQKKSQRTPKSQIEKAEQIKREYEEEKK